MNTYLSCRICEGFNDAEGTREFLFALPRFARDEVEDKCISLALVSLTIKFRFNLGENE